MPNLYEIADAKIRSDVARELESLTKDIDALKNRNAAKGLLRSGATVSEAVDRCSVVFDRARDAIRIQITWVVETNLIQTETTSDRLIAISREHFDQIFQAADTIMGQVVALAGGPSGLFDEMHARLVRSKERVLSEVSLHLDGEIRANRARFIRKAIAAVGNTVKSLFGI